MKSSTAVAALGALAQETRLAIFRALVEAGPDGLSAGAIADKLGVPAPTLSFHLSQLAHAGLVSSTRHSRSIVYTADFEAMRTLVDFLTENCCSGNPEQCAPVFLPRSPRGARAPDDSSRRRPHPSKGPR